MPELTEVFRRYGAAYLQRFGQHILPNHRRVMRDILSCRTPLLGGCVYHCAPCDRTHYSYHSCNNRHCPKCGNADASEWLQRQEHLLLPCAYFLVTFTIPSRLHQFARSNHKLFYHLLFRCSADALLQRGRQKRLLDGLLGFIGILHTCTRRLDYHPHIHYLIPAGSLSTNARKWMRLKKPDYLLPVQALSYSFRENIKAALTKKLLTDRVDPQIWNCDWVVHAKPAGSGLPVLKYLSRFVFRTALSNNRILSANNDAVTFAYKDSHTGRPCTCSLPPLTFIARFLQHVLPRGFTRVRYYGFFSPANRAKLHKVRSLLAAAFARLEALTAAKNDPGPFRCPNCHRPMQILALLPRIRSPPSFFPFSLPSLTHA